MEYKERPIQKLSTEVIGQIAAGEVVERPASVVKELVENSIDAGADAITVELREGGVQYLRVSDNGRGIPAAQIRMAFERHATSKLRKPEELFDVHTLGFRGEALASIAAVSKVSCTTRTEKDEFGVRAQVEAGQITDVREAATPVGTTILVQDLFYNTPVRLKFLKKPAVEASLVTDYMSRLILSKPEISFRFVNQGKTVFQSVGDGKLESALFCIYGKEAMKAMHKVHGVMNGVIVDGYVGVGELSRGNRQQQSFFVNGRYFRDAVLSKALENGCQGLVMIGRFPCCALYLQMPYGQVDVNVHPNKLEVRFQNPGAVADAVETLTKEALHAHKLGDQIAGKPTMTIQQPKEEFLLVPLGDAEENKDSIDAAERQEGGGALLRSAGSSDGNEGGAIGRTAPKEDGRIQGGSQSGVASSVDMGTMDEQIRRLKPVVVSPPNAPQSLGESFSPSRVAQVMHGMQAATPGYESADVEEDQPPLPQKTRGAEAEVPAEAAEPEQESLQETMLSSGEGIAIRLIGIAFHTYLLFEAGERLLWVDQHAAHERILYDKFTSQFEGGHISQRLLSPQLVRVTAQEGLLLSEWGPMLSEIGFDVQPFDETSVAVHAIPTMFGENEDPKALLLEALDEWQMQRGKLTREKLKKQIAQMACKRAIKGGDVLSDVEVEHLLHTMLTSGILPTCPHGRPIVVEVTRRDMEKRFHRIQ